LQFNDPYIYIPPLGKASASLRCELPTALTMIEGNPHFHLRGIDHKTFLDPPSGDRATQPFLESTQWDNPVQWRGTMQIEAGSHIRLHCDYQNQDNREYVQGQDKFDNEMCSFWAYVYPAPEDRTVMDCIGTHVSEYGVGTNSCAASSACLQSCSASDWPNLSLPGQFIVGACYQKCIVDSCPNAGALLDAQFACALTSCPNDCPGANCSTCMQSKCAAQIASCQNTPCN
jgi:hypothetical protein